MSEEALVSYMICYFW